VHPTRDIAIGHAEFCGFADGLFVHLVDMTFAGPYAVSVSASDTLRIRIASPDNCEYASGDGTTLDQKGPGSAIIIEPAGQAPAAGAFDGHVVAANICIHRATLKHLYAQREHELPAAIQAFLSGQLQCTVAQQLPLNPGLLRCLEELHSCDFDGHGRRLFMRSKAIEAICHAFKLLGQEDSNLLDASAGTRRGVIKAQQILLQNFVTPPSLDDLAHQVGLGRSSLCTGFRQIVGQTVFDYIADLRMKRALNLLSRRDASITQIAYEVGYSHPSSFSLAIQRRFGATPSEIRRRLPLI
jgi:AraC-like DNA-binding protein